jgi:hypothetical protein
MIYAKNSSKYSHYNIIFQMATDYSVMYLHSPLLKYFYNMHVNKVNVFLELNDYISYGTSEVFPHNKAGSWQVDLLFVGAT